MNIYIFAPLLYLLIGYFLARTPYDLRRFGSMLLTRYIIPLIIIFNISQPLKGTFLVIIAFIVIMTIMMSFHRWLITKDPIKNLCFCYLNIGWLGLPIATTLFGPLASTLIITTYVGSSIFGNSVSAGMLQENSTPKTRMIQILRAPPVIALIIGILLIPVGDELAKYGDWVFTALKFIMSFFGMAVLGMWLAHSRIRLQDLLRCIPDFVFRGVVMLVMMYALILFGEYVQIPLITENKPTLYMMCLLPPAANLVILETHYLRTGRSAPIVACETCISIVALGIFALVVELL